MNILEYENYQEKKSHGSNDFPYITYPCSIPLDFRCVPAHWHEEMEIIYIKKGSGLITVDLTQYLVSAGSILFILPGQLHSIDADNECSAMEYENIIFKVEMLISRQSDACNSNYLLPLLDGSLHIPSHFSPEMDHYTDIASCIDEADRICMTCPPGYQLSIKGWLFLLFYILLSQCSTSQPVHKHNKSLDQMKQIIKYIENNYMNKLTIEDMAKTLGLSQSHFMKVFKKAMGTTFTEYLNNYRLSIASRLLISSESSIIDIAAEVGFDNLSYFNRLFRKRFGITPSAYRKSH